MDSFPLITCRSRFYLRCLLLAQTVAYLVCAFGNIGHPEVGAFIIPTYVVNLIVLSDDWQRLRKGAIKAASG